jgi:hypothetical protein
MGVRSFVLFLNPWDVVVNPTSLERSVAKMPSTAEAADRTPIRTKGWSNRVSRNLFGLPWPARVGLRGALLKKGSLQWEQKFEKKTQRFQKRNGAIARIRVRTSILGFPSPRSSVSSPTTKISKSQKNLESKRG